MLARFVLAFLLCAPAAHAENFVALAPSAPKALPEIHYQDAAGATQALSAGSAKLTILHFWATWCVPCVAELPKLDEVAGKYEGKGLKVIALSLDTKMDKAKQFMADHKITHLTPYIDQNSSAFRALMLRGLPDSIFIDAKGQEIGRAEGPFDWNTPANAAFIEKELK